MLRSYFAIAVAALITQTPALHAEGGEHVAKAGSISIIHTWVRAAEAGQNTLVFMEFENTGAADTLERAEAEAATSARIVGVTSKDGVAGTQDVGAIEIPAGDFMFDPNGLAVELIGLKQALAKGGGTEIELHFKNAGSVHVHAEIEAANAKRHSHAGHAH